MSVPSGRIKSIPYSQILKERFNKEPQEAIDHLNAMLEAPEEAELFLLALGQVAKALEITDLANHSELARENIHKMLLEGNLSILKSAFLLLDKMGLQLTVVKKQTIEPDE